MNKVLILMAVFNGEKFIKAQIDSIKKQTFKKWDLLISDDHSTDSTVNIIIKEIESYPNIRLIINKGLKGALGNFSFLLKNTDNYNYVMFSDQDDVWNEDKIELTVQEMILQEKKYGNQTPILVYSERELVDSKLNVLPQRNLAFRDDLLSLLAQNPVYGCTMMANRALIDKCGAIPSYVQMHDYYYALMAATYGIIYKIPRKLMKYRLHNNNVTGGLNNYSLHIKLSTWTKVNDKINQMLLQNYFFCKFNMINSTTGEFISMLQLHGVNRLIRAYRIGYKKVGLLPTLRLYYVLYNFVIPNLFGDVSTKK